MTVARVYMTGAQYSGIIGSQNNYKLVSLRPRDHADAESVVRRQGDSLDDAYVLDILRQFEQALDDSTLVAEYQRLRTVTLSDS